MAFTDASFNRFEREIGAAAQMMHALDANAPVAKRNEVTAQALNALYTSIGQFGGIDLTQKQAILEKAASVVELARQDLSDDTQKMVGSCKSFIQARRDEVEQTLIASMKDELDKLYPRDVRMGHLAKLNADKDADHRELIGILRSLPTSVRQKLEREGDPEITFAVKEFYDNMHSVLLKAPNKTAMIREGLDLAYQLDPTFRPLREKLMKELSTITAEILRTPPDRLDKEIADYNSRRDALLRIEKAVHARNPQFDPKKSEEEHIQNKVLFDPTFRPLREKFMKELSMITAQILRTPPDRLDKEIAAYNSQRDVLLRIEKAVHAKNPQFDPKISEEEHIQNKVLFSDGVLTKLATAQCGVMDRAQADAALKKCAPDEWFIRFSAAQKMYIVCHHGPKTAEFPLGLHHKLVDSHAELNKLLQGDTSKCISARIKQK